MENLNQIQSDATSFEDMPELPLAERQNVAELLLGAKLAWGGGQAFCKCPGAASHSSSNPTECMVYVDGAPNVFCQHGSCKGACLDASRTLQKLIGQLRFARHQATQLAATSAQHATTTATPSRSKSAPPPFDPAHTADVASRLTTVDADFLRLRSPHCVIEYTPARVLRALYQVGEIVAVYHRYRSRSPYLWKVSDDRSALNSYVDRGGAGAWFLNSPLTGEGVPVTPPEGAPYKSFTKLQCATGFPFLVLETDKATPDQWLTILAHAELPIVAITHSGSKGAHALVRVDATSAKEAADLAAEIARHYTRLGADPGALTPRRLTRLPGCLREGSLGADGQLVRFAKPARQRLLYLNPKADGTPIADLETHPF